MKSYIAIALILCLAVMQVQSQGSQGGSGGSASRSAGARPKSSGVNPNLLMRMYKQSVGAGSQRPNLMQMFMRLALFEEMFGMGGNEMLGPMMLMQGGGLKGLLGGGGGMGNGLGSILQFNLLREGLGA